VQTIKSAARRRWQAREVGPRPSDAAMSGDAERLAIEPVFVRDVSDRI
jgi:hypothetical protein